MAKYQLKSTTIHYKAKKSNAGRRSSFNSEQLKELEKWFLKVKGKKLSDVDLGCFNWVEERKLKNWLNNRKSKELANIGKSFVIAETPTTSARRSRSVSEVTNSAEEYQQELRFVKGRVENLNLWLKEAEVQNESLLKHLNILEKDESLKRREIEKVFF